MLPKALAELKKKETHTHTENMCQGINCYYDPCTQINKGAQEDRGIDV